MQDTAKKATDSCDTGHMLSSTLHKKCTTHYSKNVTINNIGEIVVTLGSYFQPPMDIKKLVKDKQSDIYQIIRLSVPDKPKKFEFQWHIVSYIS